MCFFDLSLFETRSNNVMILWKIITKNNKNQNYKILLHRVGGFMSSLFILTLVNGTHQEFLSRLMPNVPHNLFRNCVSQQATT